MLDLEELDLVFVSSLLIYHFEMVKQVLNKGVNVVCQKPFTMNSRESEELLRMSKSNKAKVFVDFEWRYHPARQKVKELISELGDILHFDYHISAPKYQNLQTNKRGWMGEKQQFGGMLGALGTHMIDCLRWLVQDEVIKSKWHHIYGFTPQGIFKSIKNHWIFTLISIAVGAALSAVFGIVFLDFL